MLDEDLVSKWFSIISIFVVSKNSDQKVLVRARKSTSTSTGIVLVLVLVLENILVLEHEYFLIAK